MEIQIRFCVAYNPMEAAAVAWVGILTPARLIDRTMRIDNMPPSKRATTDLPPTDEKPLSGRVIPTSANQNRCAQSRIPIDMIFHG